MKEEALGADFETFLKTATFNVLIISLTTELNKPKPSRNKCLEMFKALEEKRDAKPGIGQLKAGDAADVKIDGVETSGQQKRKRDVRDDGTPGEAAAGQSQTKKGKKKYKEKTHGDAGDGGEGGDQKDRSRTEPRKTKQLETAMSAMNSAKIPVFDSESDDESPESDEEAAGEIKNESPEEKKSLGPEDRAPKEIVSLLSLSPDNGLLPDPPFKMLQFSHIFVFPSMLRSLARALYSGTDCCSIKCPSHLSSNCSAR
jgi:hypothetical protein